jgi:hypothetical protein
MSTPLPSAITLRANNLRLPIRTSLPVSSISVRSFLLRISLPHDPSRFFNALIDSGATENFISTSLSLQLSQSRQRLPAPIPLELFDGEPTSSGDITHANHTTITFANGIPFPIRLYETKLHPAGPIVLGLPWLRQENPDIDWEALTLRFRKHKLAAAINLELAPTDFEVIESELPPATAHSPVLTTSATSVPPPSVPLPPDPSRRSTPPKLEPKIETVPDLDLPASDPDPTSAAPHISLIGAAPFALLMKNGAEVFQLHISPVSPENLRANAVPEPPKAQLSEDELLHKVVPPEYHAYADVFSEGVAKELPPHRPYDHPIDIEEGETPPFRKMYNMSELELKSLKDYLDDMLGKGFIRPSSSSAGAPVLFARKKDGSLRLCVDYRGLNRVTKKNRYPIPLIGDLIDRLKSAKIFSKIDLRAGYNNIRIRPGDEWKTAFRTRYGLFEYLVMPFGMTNAPATFQYFMNDIFHDMVDVFVIIYLDDILIFSNNLDEHRVHVKTVLERLRQHNLHAKPEKCDFHTTSVEYLGVIITPDGVKMDPSKVKTIIDWPTPKSVKQLQSFLGFANFYRRFIDNYSGITKPLTQLLHKDQKWAWNTKCDSVFALLKTAFSSAPILRHFDPSLPIILECDASDYAIAGIISQYDPSSSKLHPVAFYAQSMISAEINYDIYDKELLAIVDAFKIWRAYLEGSPFQIQIYSDHNNLQFFTTTKTLNRRQARWSEYLSAFDFHINYRPGRLGAKPDALTRRPDVYPKSHTGSPPSPHPVIRPEQLNASLIMNDSIILAEIASAPHDEYFNSKLPDTQLPDSTFSLSPDNSMLLQKNLIYVPDHNDLRLRITQSHHDHKLRGHLGIRKTIQLVNRTYFWPGLKRDITNYICTCHQCLRAKSPRHKPYGLLKPLPVAERPWVSISLDHITDLPLSNGFNAILVVVCRLTKQGIFVPCHTTDDAPQFALLFIMHVFSKHGLPADIISDRGSLFISHF